MIEQIPELQGSLPFSYEQRESVIIASSPIVTDLIFLEEVNSFVLKDYPIFREGLTPVRGQTFFDLEDGDDESTLSEMGFDSEFIEILLSMCEGLETTLLGIQVTGPKKEMCPSFHVDKLPLRIVQCINSKGPMLKTPREKVIETEANDLVFLKGEMWKSDHGGVVHCSPDTLEAREIIRIDFLN